MSAELTSSKSSANERQQLDPSLWLEQHGDYLFRYAMFRLRDRGAAEDVVQETLLAGLQAHQNYVGQASERTWLTGILKHKIIDHYRRISRTQQIFSEEQNDEYDPFEKSGPWTGHWREDLAPIEWQLNASITLESKEFWEVFERCLSQLPQRTSLAFTLREIDGMSPQQICEVLNVSSNNLCVMLHRARLRLRGTLEAEWFGKEPRRQGKTADRARVHSSIKAPVFQRVLKFVGIAA